MNIMTFYLYLMYKLYVALEQAVGGSDSGAGLTFVHDNFHYLTGVVSIKEPYRSDSITCFTEIAYHVQWIRGIYIKHVAVNSCILPTVEGVIYSYEGSNAILSHGTLINHHLTVIENCEVGYHKASPYSFRVCQGEGKWLSNSEKLCFKMCPPLESDSLDIKCSHNGKYTNCSNLSILDTIATSSCKSTYSASNEQEETPLELHCQANGKWNKELYRCNPYCGRVYIKTQELFEIGERAPVGTAPWNVGIYKLNQTKSDYELICGGSIISPKLIVSAAHCFWRKDMLSNTISINDSQYKIAVGKYARDFSIIDNEFTDIINVEMIHMNENFYGPNGFYAKDIAIIVLQNRVSFSNGVAPVCIDWYFDYNVINGDIGKIVGWGKTEKGVLSPILLEASLPYIDHNSCRNMYGNGFEQFVTVDKFCAGSTLGQGAGLGDGGAGITFLHNNSYYLTGVVSIKDPNKNNSISVFTNIRHNIQWIRELLNKHVTENSCVLPTIEGVIYSYEGSNAILPHGKLINNHLTVIENCEHGYHKTYPNSFRICQSDGKWITVSDKLCLKMCPPLQFDGLDIKCTLNNKYANCSNLSIPDTIATPSCKPIYNGEPNDQEQIPLELYCQSNGTWNKELYKCNTSYCGKIFISNQVLISNGDNTTVGSAPWNVGLYQLNKKNSNYDMICGGSIISPNLVISAAHCFWQKGMLSKRISISDGLYKIAVGKYTRDFSVIDSDFTQIIDVKMIHLNEGYYGPPGFHAEDIAIIVLQIRVSFNNGVAPVCIDWIGKYTVANGDQGKIVGWGKTEKDILSPVLLEASLPFINHSSCRNMYTNGFESFVTFDKFCAGSASVSGQGMGKGDSGSGLCFLHFGAYYLTGIVSVKDPNTKNSIAVFTDVKHHIQWIRRLYNKYN